MSIHIPNTVSRQTYVVMGIDPGKTTGIFVIEFSEGATACIGKGDLPLHSKSSKEERPLPDLYAGLLSVAVRLPAKAIDQIVIEDVVKSGIMNRDKYDQICAFTHAMIFADMLRFEQGSNCLVDIISPEARKNLSKAGRKAFYRYNNKHTSSRHTKDALSLVLAWADKANKKIEG